MPAYGFFLFFTFNEFNDSNFVHAKHLIIINISDSEINCNLHGRLTHYYCTLFLKLGSTHNALKLSSD